MSIASSIFIEETVLVTRNVEDATLVTRRVVRGHMSSHSHAGDESSDDVGENKPYKRGGTLNGRISTMVDEILLFHKQNEAMPAHPQRRRCGSCQ